MPFPDLQPILDDIARKEIADDMNLWNGIHDNIQKLPAPPARSTVLGLSRVAAAVVAMLIFGTAYAVYQAVMRGGDPGIQAVSELITDFGITQNMPDYDINVTFDWAYADGHRIAVGWQVDYPIGFIVFPSVTLTDAQGSSFKYADFLQGGGGGGGGNESRITVAGVTSFDATGIAPDTEMLELSVHFEFKTVEVDARSEIMSPPPPISGTPVPNGSGELPHIAQPLPEPFTLSFDFEVPFIPAQPIGDFSVEQNGITLSLSDVSYAPSIMLASLCYNLTGEVMFTPHFAGVDPMRGFTSSFYTEQAAPDENGIVCGSVNSFTVPDADTGIIRLVVERLVTNYDISAERVAQLQVRIEEEGLPFEVEHIEPDTNTKGYDRMNINYLNAGSENQAEDYAALDALQTEVFLDTIEGPWVFDIPLR